MELSSLRPGPGASNALWWAARIAFLPAVAVLLAPLFATGMTADDWALYVLGAMVDNPLRFYLEDHSAGFFYRPNTMLVWSLVANAWPQSVEAQYTVSFIVHGLNAALLATWIHALGCRRAVALLAGLFFILVPATTGTVLWLSNRFDLMATTGVLATMLALEQAIARPRLWPWITCFSFLAMGSKELGVVVLPLLLLRLLQSAELTWRARLWLFAAGAMPVLCILVWRTWLLSGVAGAWAVELGPMAFWEGSWVWLLRALEVLAGMLSIPVLLAGLILLAALLWMANEDRRKHSLRGPFLPLLGLALTPVLAQWPLTAVQLLRPDALELLPNYRFYYLASAGALGLLACAAASLRRQWQVVVLILMLAVLAVPAIRGSRAIVEQWAHAHGVAQDAPAQAAAIARAQPPGEPCVLQFLGIAAVRADSMRFFDAAVKSQLRLGEPAMNCLIMADEASWYAIFPRTQCDPQQSSHGQSISSMAQAGQRFGPLCFHFPVGWDVVPTGRWIWRDGRFEPLVEGAAAP